MSMIPTPRKKRTLCVFFVERRLHVPEETSGGCSFQALVKSRRVEFSSVLVTTSSLISLFKQKHALPLLRDLV